MSCFSHYNILADSRTIMTMAIVFPAKITLVLVHTKLSIRETLTHSCPPPRIQRSLFTVWNYHIFLNPFRNVVKSFYTSSLLYDVLTQFGELSQEVFNNIRLFERRFYFMSFLNSGWRDKGLELFSAVWSFSKSHCQLANQDERNNDSTEPVICWVCWVTRTCILALLCRRYYPRCICLCRRLWNINRFWAKLLITATWECLMNVSYL